MKAVHAANYLVYLMSDVCDDLTNMKINKLLYYAQGHCLKETGAPLFDEEIEAWQHGPIIRSVYKKYSDYEDSPIRYWDDDDLQYVTVKEKALLMDIALNYGRYTASALRNMTHARKSPWDMVYDPDERGTVIPNTIIKDYFVNNIESIKPAEINYSEDDFIGYRDENGYIVLPKEWDDETV